MGVKKNKIYQIYKVSTDTLTKSVNEDGATVYELKVDDFKNIEIVSISDNQVFRKILDYYGSDDKRIITCSVVNLVVPHRENNSSKKEKEFEAIAKAGFYCNGKHFKRLCAAAGQIRQNTVSFIHDELYDYLVRSLCCGLIPEDFGNKFNTAKYNSYFGLAMSGVSFLESAPRVCIIDDYEAVMPHELVDFVYTTETTFPGTKKKSEYQKHHIQCYYDEPKVYGAKIEKPYALNSFDGQGIMSVDWAIKIAWELGYREKNNKGYFPSQLVIRAPFVKGLLCCFDWKAYLRQYGVTTLTDSFGTEKNIEDIDILVSKSQFKMHKIFKQIGGWESYEQFMQQFNLRWGVVLPNRQYDARYKAINYQYGNILEDIDIDALCAYTTENLTELCSGNKERVFQALIRLNHADIDDSEVEEVKPVYESLLERVIKLNENLLQDTYIQNLIYQESKTKFKNAKLGKVHCRGNYQFMVSDPVAQAQWVVKNHAVDGQKDIEVTGLIPAGSVYSDYWNRQPEQPSEVVLMRSPLIAQSEAAIRTLYKSSEAKKWYKNAKSGIILSIGDLTTLQTQNSDFDGDRIYSSCQRELIEGVSRNPIPLMFPKSDDEVTDSITEESLIAADLRGLNCKVGSYSNRAAGFHAKLAQYPKGSAEYNKLLEYIMFMGEIIGVEIDSAKSGVKPKLPAEWRKLDMPRGNDETGQRIILCSKEEEERIATHNALVDDRKPYYFRYNYNSLDRNIIRAKQQFNKECFANYGMSLDKLMMLPELTEAQQRTIDHFMKVCGVIDSPCTVNKICRKFEALEKQLKKHNDSKDLLQAYVKATSFDPEKQKQVKHLHSLFKKHRRSTARFNTSEAKGSNRVIAEWTKNELNKMLNHIRRRLIDVCGDDAQAIYDYCFRCGDVKFAWKVLDELMLQIIGGGDQKPSDYFGFFMTEEYSTPDSYIWDKVEESVIESTFLECTKPLKIYKEELEILSRPENQTVEELGFACLITAKLVDDHRLAKNQNNPDYHPLKWVYANTARLYEIADNGSSGSRRNKLWNILSQHDIVKYKADTERNRATNQREAKGKFWPVCKRDYGELAFEVANPKELVQYYRAYKGLIRHTKCCDCGKDIFSKGNRKKYCDECARLNKNKKNRAYREESRES